MIPSNPELVAPAGNFECARAAVANGADAVYFGLPRFNARLRADNFRREDLPELMRFLRAHGVKGYAALNVLIFPGELKDAVDELLYLHECGVHAVIIQDVGLATLAARLAPGLCVHASTQMTITSPEGVEFARSLGVKQVVLARELSLRELKKFPTELPLEVFVHGALCVAYSGQCLTSEALGQRSANRGECAQACRMPYELIVDGTLRELGDRRYLLSPQDLAAIREIPALIKAGVKSFKIEGRLKEPEYVAAVTAAYRKAIDAALSGTPFEPSAQDWYALEMTFSRGLYTGWMHGVNHQELVGARFGKKRGPFVGFVIEAIRDAVRIDSQIPLAPGDGVVFDTGGDTNHEQGGRIFSIADGWLRFEPGKLDPNRIPPGTRVWKTDDPQLRKALRRTWKGRLPQNPLLKIPLRMLLSGAPGEPLVLSGETGEKSATVRSSTFLKAAKNVPLDAARAAASLSRLEETPFVLKELSFEIRGAVFVPPAVLNRMRRALVDELLAQTPSPPPDSSLPEILESIRSRPAPPAPTRPQLLALCRDMEQVGVCLEEGVDGIILDFEDIRRYAPAVRTLRANGSIPVFLATPRIQKAGEAGFFRLIARAEPDGVLVRNIGGIRFFKDTFLRRIGDFSLNVANPVTAARFLDEGLERVTVSYDLNAEQVVELARGLPHSLLELTIHQHMPMFHMEHCVFAAFMSNGKDFRDCGRPCEKHRVHLRDRVGIEHPLRADVGCRNTLFHAVAQSGAADFPEFLAAGIHHYRVELLEETAETAREIIRTYRALLDGSLPGAEVWRRLNVRSQLGVTRGTLAPPRRE
jgi:putative protease